MVYVLLCPHGEIEVKDTGPDAGLFLLNHYEPGWRVFREVKIPDMDNVMEFIKYMCISEAVEKHTIEAVRQIEPGQLAGTLGVSIE